MVKATIANLGWLTANAAAWAAFSRALEDPAQAQEKLLRQYLHNAADTAFGREHGLCEIRSYQQFARHVPIRDYDEFQPWIDRIRRGERRVLTSAPILRLVPSSGSTAARKLIPYTAESHREMNRAIGPWICDLYRRQPHMIRGRSYWSVTPSMPHAPNGEPTEIPVGFDDDAAYLGGWSRHLIDAAMAVPGDLKDISSIDVLRYVTLLLLLRCKNLALISVWHPSFLELLFAAIPIRWRELLTDICRGECAVIEHVPRSLHARVLSHPDPDRARELHAASSSDLAKLWPMLSVVSCWADGHAAAAANALSTMLPGVTIQPKGLLATEGVISIPFAGQHPLAIQSHFFEFVDGAGNAVLASELKSDQSYGVILTTAGGLWRYRLGDLIQVTGIVGRTPSISFTGKAGLVSDRMGEKLSDGFVAGVLARLFRADCPRPSFALLAPEVNEKGCRYILYTNADGCCDLDKRLDDELCANSQYAYCRRLGQLSRAARFRITGNAYGSYCERLCSLGQRLGDIKPASLSPLCDWCKYFIGEYINPRSSDGCGKS